MLKPVVLMPKNEALARIEANRRLIEERLRGIGAMLVRVSIEDGNDYYDPDSGYYSIILVVRIGNKLRSYKPCPVSPHPNDPNHLSSLSGLVPILGASLVSFPTGLGARALTVASCPRLPPPLLGRI